MIQNTNYFLLAAICIGLILILWQFYLLFKIFQSKGWKQTEGKIISSKLGILESFGEVDAAYKAKIKYQYKVEDKEYTSKRIFWGDASSSSIKFKHTRILKKYPVGKIVNVYYNPFNPKESVVERRIDIDIFLLVIIGLSTIIVSSHYLDAQFIRQFFK